MENINRSNTAGDEQKKLYETPDRPSTSGDAAAKKKLMIVGGLAGAVTLVGVILIIVFATMKSTPVVPPGPPAPHEWNIPGAPAVPGLPPLPKPPVKPAFKHYNPYLLEGTPVDTGYSYSGFLKGTYPSGQLLAQVQQEKQAISEESDKDGADPVPAISTIGIDVAKIPVGVNNKQTEEIAFSFGMIDPKTMKLNFGDQNAAQVPTDVVPQPSVDHSIPLKDVGFEVFYGTQTPLSFRLKHDDNEAHDWVNTRDASLVFAEKYIQMDFILPSDEIYGFGERVHETKLAQGAWTMWNKNKIPGVDTGYGKGMQSYGTHPFLLYKNPANNKFGGVFFRNANNQAPIIVFNEDKTTKAVTTTLSYITTGGQVEAYFFVDGSAEEIIRQYQTYFGMPSLPPFYALGWQQSSDSYLKNTEIDAVLAAYSEAGMPLDSVWMPFGTQYKGLPFTVDNAHFMENTKTYYDSVTNWKIQSLDKNNVKLVMKTHPAFPIDKDFNLWNLLHQEEALVKTTINTDKFAYLTADTDVVKQANFADFMHPKGREVWSVGIESLMSQVSFDGISIEEDGPYTDAKCPGECPGPTPDPSPPQMMEYTLEAFTASDDPTIYTKWYQTYEDQTKVSTYYLPFEPGVEGGAFDDQTLSLNATSTDSKTVHQMYNVRNMYGLMMAQTTYNTYMSGDLPVGMRRPLIYSQSTFSAASGKVSSHIAAPVARSWDWLRYSVAQMLNMNILGVPMTGVDVCGTMGAQDEELCAYWYQLAVFSPIARNNYVTTDKTVDLPNEPYLTKDAGNKELIKQAMLDRMSLMRYMYTELYKVTQKGGALIKPMFFSNPADTDALKDVEQDFMVGDYVKVSPVLSKANKDSYTAYFPTATNEKWVNIFDTSKLVSTTPDAAGTKEADKKFQRATLSAGAHVNAYLMPGAIIPMQATTYMDKDDKPQPVKTSTDLMNHVSLDLMVNLNANMEASGEVLIDDGFSQEMLDNKLYDYYTFSYSAGNLRKEWAIDTLSTGLPDSVTQQTRYLNSITFTNMADKNFDFACYNTQEGGKLLIDALTQTTSTDKNTVTFTLNQPVNLYSITGIYIGDSTKHTNLCTVNDHKWIAKTLPDLSGKQSATVALTSTNDKDTTVINVMFELLAPFSPEQFQDISVKIAIDNAPFKTFMASDVLSAHATTKTTVGDLSKRLNITPGSVTIDPKTKEITSIVPFSFQILSDEDHKTAIYDTKDHPLFISQYLMLWGGSMKTGIFNKFTPAFGLGERVEDFWLKDGIYSFWNRNMPESVETEHLPAHNGYGTHPYIAWKTPMNNFASTFIMNTAANDIELGSEKTHGNIMLDQISVGGNLHLYFSEARRAETLIKQYHTLVGMPQLPPQWMLGWNQAKFGYKTLADVKAAVQAYTKDGIPLEAIWNDVSYMEFERDFTIDSTNYSGLADYVENTLHKFNQKYVPIVNAGVAYTPEDDNYTPFADGMTDKIFINEFSNKEPFIGKAWAGSVVYPDWTNAKTQAYWEKQLTAFAAMVNFDALWLDSNEAANFCDGPCLESQKNPTTVLLDVPYWPTGRSLNEKSIDVDAIHSTGERELEMHNVFALQQVKATHTWFQNKKQRTALVSRSSFAGQGKFGGRSFGDNFSTVQDMMLSVPSTMMMNIFGLTTGAPNVCGFFGEASPELCARWTKLSTFYPFARNHNVGTVEQAPYAAQYKVEYPEAQVAKTTYSQIMIQAIKERYNLIPYLYSHLIQISQEGGVYFKPLFFDYPEDADLYHMNYNDFLIGDSLKVSIQVSDLGTTESGFYFPDGVWCSLWAMSEPCMNITGDVTGPVEHRNNQTLASTADVSHVHAKVGSIVPTAKLDSIDKIMTTSDVRANPTDLHIFPMENGVGNPGFQAYQEIYYTDDGENFESTDFSKGTVNGYQFYMTANPSSERFEILVTHKVKATTGTGDMCNTVTGNDNLGEIYVHNAENTDIQLDNYFGVINFNDGSKEHIIPEADISYIMNGDRKLVLKVKQQMIAGKTDKDPATPVCFGNIKNVSILKGV